jgi:hypothetical protein
MPIKALTDKRARGQFLDWRDELALSSPRQADYAWTVLAAVLAWGADRGKILVNPCQRGGRVYHSTRVDKVWSIEDEEAFLKSTAAHLHLPLLMALWTGQRQGDLLRLPWTAYDGKEIRLRQSKSVRKGARRYVHVTIPVGAPLKEALDAAARTRRSTIILTTMEGTPWTARRLPGVLGQGGQEGGGVRRHVQRPARNGGHAAGPCRLHRGRDRVDHRAQPARRPVDPRCPLSAPRPGTRPHGDPQAGDGLREAASGGQNRNRFSKMTSKTDVLFYSKGTKKRCDINWLGFLNSFRTICLDSKGEIQSVFEEMRSAHQLVI